ASPPAPLPDVRPTRAGGAPRPVQSLLPVLAADRPRATARPAAEGAGASAPLPPLWAPDGGVDPWPLPRLLRVLAPDRPRAPRAPVAALKARPRILGHDDL